ncbi:type II toxin-antitoxin system RelE/ParE family toxin [Kamptonema cortianum]|nr:type II toxin-antitoxin system RelE/ParE family toxin [Oscillatoria laete-virens]MDK3157995.1 type II toxin-antitoxin system RelE/ParE family toxin [Kamptonema cortianum]MDL5053127.1 type II toxin-antitoxin system RelE/ParE family toxin [Oscillatoria laete-virens NRMC-F 0139]
MKCRFFPAALREVREAVEYYESCRQGLGKALLTSVRDALDRICGHPEAWTLLHPGIRRCRLKRFPYGVIYAVRETEIIILSFMHLHRHPESWRKNL